MVVGEVDGGEWVAVRGWVVDREGYPRGGGIRHVFIFGSLSLRSLVRRCRSRVSQLGE